MANDKPLSKAGDFPPAVLSLFDKYVHNIIDRREFLEGAAKFSAGGVTAEALLEALSPRFAERQQVPAADPRLDADYVEFASPLGYGGGRGDRGGLGPPLRAGDPSCSWCTRTAG